MDVQYYKLEIFVPETHFRVLQKALQEADAGHIGNYDSCLSYSRVTGTWRPLSGTHPFIGAEGEVSEEGRGDDPGGASGHGDAGHQGRASV